jgi:hypothetical protein
MHGESWNCAEEAMSMTYADAVKRATDIWFERLKDPALPLLCAVDKEALAALRRAEGVMGAVEAISPDNFLNEDGEFIMGLSKAILRAALAYKEQAK